MSPMSELALHHHNSLNAALNHSGAGAIIASAFLILFIGAGRSGGQAGK